MKQILLFMVFIICLTSASFADTSKMNDGVDIKRHELSIQIFPKEQLLKGVDEVILTKPPNGQFKFSFGKNMTIANITSGGKELDFTAGPFEGDEFSEEGLPEYFQQVTLDMPKGVDVFRIEYSGIINDPIQPGKTLIHVRGDSTSGIISEKGVYISSVTGWYADTDVSMATYRVAAYVPSDWYVCTQGDLIERDIVEDRRVSVWDSKVQTDGCVLVANAFKKRTRTIQGVDCSTYFLQDDENLSNSFFDKLDEYLPAYVKLFGDFPFTRFDITENFFSTGYGMPGYTLLGNRVLRMPYATLEGSLAHEMVHCYWGNYVVPDWNNGNWCEGLTYYTTNYYWNILSGNLEAAKDFRVTDMIKFAMQVPVEEQYPLRKFRSKFTVIDGNIGYGKSSAVFGMLHNRLGDDNFFKALQRIIDVHGGEITDWDQFRMIFEDISGENLQLFFSTWLDNKGAPALSCDSIKQTKSGNSYMLEFNINQEDEAFHFWLPVVFKTATGETTETLLVDSTSNEYKLSFLNKVESFELDPEHTVFRKIYENEYIPNLSAASEASDSVIVILPSGGNDDMLDITVGFGPMAEKKTVSVKQMYEDIASEMPSAGINATIKYDSEITEDDLKSSSIICLGASRYNSVAAELALKAGDVLNLESASFDLDGTTYDSEGASALVNIRNPFNEKYYATFYFGNSPQAVFKANYIFFYRSWSYVVYEDGNRINRHKWESKNSLVYNVS